MKVLKIFLYNYPVVFSRLGDLRDLLSSRSRDDRVRSFEPFQNFILLNFSLPTKGYDQDFSLGYSTYQITNFRYPYINF